MSRGRAVVAVVAVVALVPAVWLGLRAGGTATDTAADPSPTPEPAGPVDVPVGEPATLSVDGYDVTLAISAEHDADEALAAVPPGRPVTLTATVADADGEPVELDPLPAIRPDGDDDDRVERLVLDLDGGRVVGAEVPGDTGWEVDVAAGGDDVVVSDDGRWVGIVHGEAGAVEVVDVLERRSTGRFVLGTGADDAVFSPSGETLWVLDVAAGRLVAVDAALGRPTQVVAASDVRSVVVLESGHLVALGADGAVLVLDAESGEELATGDGVGEAVAAAAVPGGVVVASGDGNLHRIDVADDGVPSPGWSSEVGVEIAAMGADPGGRVVALDPDGDRALVVDPLTAEVVGEVATAEEPADVSFVDGIAVVRNAGSPALTWIDVADPAAVGEVVLGREPPATVAATVEGAGLLVTSPADGATYSLEVRLGRPVVVGHDDLPADAEQVVEVPVGTGRVAPGTYRLRTTFDEVGTATVAVDLGERRVVEFQVAVAEPDEPAGPASEGGAAGDAEAEGDDGTAVAPGAVLVGHRLEGVERVRGAQEGTLTRLVPGTWRVLLVERGVDGLAAGPAAVPRDPFEAQ